MDRTLFIHIGPPKTGTTAIQRCLCINKKILDEHGLHYIDTLRYCHGGHNPLVMALHYKRYGTHIDDDSMCYGKMHEKYLYELSSEVNRNKNRSPIISSELIPMLGKDEVDDLLSLFPPLKTKVIYYVRNFRDLLTSFVSQIIRNQHLYSVDDRITSIYCHVESFVDNCKKCLDIWSDKIGRENIIFRKYDVKYFPKGNICHDFLHAIGYCQTDDLIMSNELYNKSLKTCETIYFKDLLNRLTLRTSQLVIENHLYAWEKYHAGTSFYLPNDLAAKIDNDVVKVHHFLLENYLDHSYADLLNKRVPTKRNHDFTLSYSDFINIINYLDSRISGFKEEFFESLAITLNRSYDHELSIRRSVGRLLDSLWGRKAIAFWGCGDVANRILKDHKAIMDLPLYMVDKDVKKHGSYFHEHKILSPSVIATEDIDTVIIASVAYAEEIHKEIKRHYSNVRYIIKLDYLAGKIDIQYLEPEVCHDLPS